MVACRRVRKRDAIHDRHADIGDQQLEGAFFARERVKRLRAVGCGDDVVAVLPERARNQAADRVLVLCDQNARHGHCPMTVPDLLSTSAAGTISRLDGSGRPLTNSPTMGRRLARAGRPRELKSEGKPTRRRMAGLLAHPSVAKAEARNASRCYKAR